MPAYKRIFEMEVNFKGTLSKNQYLKAHKLSFPYKKLRTLVLFLIPLLIIHAIFDFYRNRKLWIFSLFLALFWIYYFLKRKYYIWKYWNQSKVIKEPRSGVVSDKGIITSSKSGNANITWDYFIKYKISPDMIILHSTTLTSNIFPRSFFENDNDWESFVEMVKNNVPSK
jgi:hypothetical protein